MFFENKSDNVETLMQQRAEGCSTLHKIVTMFGYKTFYYIQENKQSLDRVPPPKKKSP